MGHRWYEGVRLTCALLSSDDGDWSGPALEVRLLIATHLLGDDRIEEGLMTDPRGREAELVLDSLHAVLSTARSRLAQ